MIFIHLFINVTAAPNWLSAARFLGLYAMIENWTKEFIIQRLLAITLLVVLIVLCFQVVQFFIVPALWAAILGVRHLSDL